MLQDGLSVVIVDDDETVVEMIRMYLESEGHTVSTRTRGLGTSAMVLRDKPDLVLLDLEMPGISGQEIARLLQERGGKSAIVLHSAKSESELRAIAHELGVDAYIPKGTLAEFHDSFQRVVESLDKRNRFS